MSRRAYVKPLTPTAGSYILACTAPYAAPSKLIVQYQVKKR